MKLSTGILLVAASLVLFLATKTFSESEAEEKTNWGKPQMIAVPSAGGTVKGVVRIRPLPKKEGEDENDKKDPMDARMPEIDIKSLVIPRWKLVWIGASQYEHFFVMKDKIIALYPTAGADLSVSIVSAHIPNSGDADDALRDELDRRFESIAEHPLRYQYWISLRRLFGQDAFVDASDPRIYSVPRISGITFGKGNAVVALVEPNRKKSTLTFDPDLRVIAADREGHSITVTNPVAPQKLTMDKD
jgi:hypothetical protein